MRAPSLAGPRLDLSREERAGEPSEGSPDFRHPLTGKHVLQCDTVRASAAQGRGRRVREEDRAVRAICDDSGRQVREERREALLLPRESVGLFFQAARHREEGAHQLPELLVGRLLELR
jgi:hypothetical protein